MASSLVFIMCTLLAVTLITARMVIVCPPLCTCQQPNNKSLAIDCGKRKMNVTILYNSLDLLLSDVKLRERLRSLQISNTPLTEIPVSVCRLSKLTSLNLDRNRLVRLRNSCINNMTQLQILSAVYNRIIQLQNRLFDGLNSLRDIKLYSNRISSIGLHVFSNPNNLVSLKLIDLDDNLLQSLEPWPIIRGQIGLPAVVVYINKNRISNFTNNIGWQFQCNSRPSYAKVHMKFNYIKHLTDVLHGWNVTSTRQILCLLGIKKDDLIVDISFSNSYHCDCRDIEYYKFRFALFSRLFCSKPPSLVPWPALGVPLIDMTCELSDRCPSRCKCIYRPANATLHVNCAAANLSALPFDMPPLPKSYDRYKLDFSWNKLLRRLDSRSYFVDTVALDVSNCAVHHIDLSAWREFARMRSPFVVPTIYLHKNDLESFPFEVTSINFSSVRFTLGRNPWQCSCANGWMIGWFQSLRSLSQNDDVNALCASPSRLKGRLISQSTEDDFCVDAIVRVLKISLSSTLSVVVFLLMSTCVIYRL